jgi:replicative DNA helicase
MSAYDEIETMALRIPPQSIEAESSVLGGLLLDPAMWDEVADTLTDADFYRYEHRLIFASIAQLCNAGKQVDMLTVFEALRTTGKADEVGGLVYLNSLAQYVPSAANIRRYAEIIRGRSLQRKLIAASDEIGALAHAGGKDADELIADAEGTIAKLLDTGPKGDDWEGSDDGMATLLARLSLEADGTVKPDVVGTGLADLDHRLDGGMRPGEVIVIGARTRMGKSALALSIIHEAAMVGKCCGFLSMEMPKKQVNNRRMSIETGIHLQRLKLPERLRNDDWPRITQAVEKMRGTQLYVSDTPGLNINQVRAKAKMLKRRRGLRVLVVDYLGLMMGLDPKNLRTYQIAEITTGVKNLAKELGLTVLLLVQIDRKVEQRADQMPTLADLRDSGSIEQDADVVLFVHREIVVKPDLGDEWKQYAKIRVAKLRDGEPGDVDMMYIGENTRFVDWPADMPVPRSQATFAKARPGL